MIGIDLTRISRFENKDENLIKKILSNAEIEEYEKAENKPSFLATRWAIKEALFKADNSLFEFNKINIEKENGKYKFNDYEISTSNEEDFVIAIVKKCECNNK